MRRIAVFLPNWIGDVVMATPAIRAVREQFAEARMLAVCAPYVADTVAGSPWFDEVILFDKHRGPCRSFLATAKQLLRNRADTAILFPNSLRSALLARAGGCSTVVGFARYGRDALLSRRLYPVRDRVGRPKPVPVIDDYNRIVQLLGVADPGHRMELFTTPADDATATAVWRKLGLDRFSQVIGLNPGGAFGAAKHWPNEQFANVARTLATRHGVGVLVLCGPSERETAREIAMAAAHPAVVSMSEEPLSIGLTKAIVRRLALLITTDSGPRHFAAAFDRPVVTLFGPTHIGWTETYYPKAIHLQETVPCGPCQQRVCPLGHHRCMTDLHPERVLAAASSLLDRYSLTTERRYAG